MCIKYIQMYYIYDMFTFLSPSNSLCVQMEVFMFFLMNVENRYSLITVDYNKHKAFFTCTEELVHFPTSYLLENKWKILTR